MAFFNKKSSMWLIIALSCVLVVIIVTAVILISKGGTSGGDNTETKFVEQDTAKVESGEIIVINDPELGQIEIEAIKGVKKNTYDKNSFKTDENGLKSYYIDGEEASCAGVDLSEYQGDVDFDKVKASGIDYVMLRIGGRYYSEEGKLYADSSFDTYYKGAKAAGLDVGAYFFSQAKTAQEAAEEATYIIGALSGYELDYPVAFDWETILEDEARTDSVTGEMLTQCAISFCDTLDEAGLESIIYSNTNLMYYMYDLQQLKEFDFWVADYEDEASMYYNFTMWQYSIKGQIDGINGDVDLNICFKNY